MQPAIDVSILVVSYETREMTLAALDSVVRETKDVSYELIVVDNASRDGSAEAIGQAFPEARLIASKENLGFARGNNLAAESARGEYLLLLNPDTLVLDGAIDKLVAFAKARPKAQIWGGRTVFLDGSLNPSSCWRRITLWNLFCRASGLTGVFPKSALFNSEAYGGWRRDSVREVDIVSGCFLLTRRDLWRRLGGFDPHFFMYGEEADLCLRAKALGARPAVTPQARIVHYGGASERTRTGKMVKLLAAKATLIERHFPAASSSMGLMLLAAWPLSRWVALSALARATGKARHAEAALTWGEIWTRRAEWMRGWGKMDVGGRGELPAGPAAARGAR